jgi:Resolvase, N terminal domain/Helix-turn-helix domain of resolvase
MKASPAKPSASARGRVSVANGGQFEVSLFYRRDLISERTDFPTYSQYLNEPPLVARRLLKNFDEVIAEWDRATRSMWDGLQIIKSVIDAGAVIKVLDRSYTDLTTPMGRGFMAMMSAMAEDERLRIIKRTHEGRQIARANGVKMGRKPILTPYQIKEARQRIAKGEKTREVAKVFNVSISTISRLADAR